MDTEKKEQAGRIRNELKQNDLSPNLLRSISLENILEVQFPEGNSDKNISKSRTRLTVCLTEMNELSSLKGNPSSCLDWLIKNRQKAIQLLIERLFEHKVLSYYFLERIVPNSSIEGYVCLLREVTSLPREIVEELSNGLSIERWGEISAKVKSDGLDFSIEEFAAPLSQLGSPSIEHVMQVYANLFGRIGIEDPRKEEITEILAQFSKVSK
jgi:hypothetical protein